MDGNVTGISQALASASGFLSILVLLVGIGGIWVVLTLVAGITQGSDIENADTATPEKITLIPKTAWNCSNCGGPNPDGSDICQYCGKAMLDLEQALDFEKGSSHSS